MVVRIKITVIIRVRVTIRIRVIFFDIDRCHKGVNFSF